MQKFFKTLKAGVFDFFEDECMVSGAALAYYTIFSLPPLLVMVFFVAGWFGVSDDTINDVVRRQVGLPVPGQEASSQKGDSAPAGAQTNESDEGAAGAAGLAQSAEQIAEQRSGRASPIAQLGPLSKVVGILILVFSATGVFAQLQRALNRAWEVQPDPARSSWKLFLAKRGLSLGMIVVIAFLLLVSLVLTTMVDELMRMTLGEGASSARVALGVAVNEGIALVLATLLFAAVYKILPDADMRWRDIWVGALITAVLFVVGKAILGRYLQSSEIGSAWGSAAASMIALLVWVYYSSLIVLLGAELTQAWAREYGQGIVPEEGAIRIVEGKRQPRGGLRQSGRAT